jgi:hypothetical protein
VAMLCAIGSARRFALDAFQRNDPCLAWLRVATTDSPNSSSRQLTISCLERVYADLILRWGGDLAEGGTYAYGSLLVCNLGRFRDCCHRNVRSAWPHSGHLFNRESAHPPLRWDAAAAWGRPAIALGSAFE